MRGNAKLAPQCGQNRNVSLMPDALHDGHEIAIGVHPFCGCLIVSIRICISAWAHFFEQMQDLVVKSDVIVK